MILKFLAMIEESDWTIDEVFEALKDQKAQLWGVVLEQKILGIWITKIENTKKTKYGLIWILAGNGLELGLPLFKICEDWLREMGCSYIEEHGRPGWQRIMKPFGYEVQYIVLRKKL